MQEDKTRGHLLFAFLLDYLFYFMCGICLYGLWRSDKVIRSLGPGVRMVVNHHVGAGN